MNWRQIEETFFIFNLFKIDEFHFCISSLKQLCCTQCAEQQSPVPHLEGNYLLFSFLVLSYDQYFGAIQKYGEHQCCNKPYFNQFRQTSIFLHRGQPHCIFRQTDLHPNFLFAAVILVNRIKLICKSLIFKIVDPRRMKLHIIS